MEKWKKQYWIIWSGQIFSIITSAIVQYGIIWYITDVTRSALILSIASLVGFLPQGILGVFVGGFIDKHDRKKIMIFSDLFIAIASLAIFIYSLFNTIPIWLLIVVLGIRSIGSAFHGPAMQASIPLIVPEEKLLKYNGYTQAGQSFSFILSPALAAFIFSFMKLGNMILLDVIGAGIAITSLLFVTIPKLKLQQNENSYFHDIKDGLKMIVKSKTLKSIFIISAIFMIVFMPVSSLYPLMVFDYFNKSTMFSGIVEICFAVGMLLGSILLSSKKLFSNTRRNITISLFIIAITLFLSGLLTPTMAYYFIVLCFLMGMAGPLYNASIATIFASEVEPQYLGRLYSNFTSISVLATPIGLLLSGAFADKIGINVWFSISGIVLLALSIIQLKAKLIKDEK